MLFLCKNYVHLDDFSSRQISFYKLHETLKEKLTNPSDALHYESRGHF